MHIYIHGLSNTHLGPNPQWWLKNIQDLSSNTSGHWQSWVLPVQSQMGFARCGARRKPTKQTQVKHRPAKMQPIRATQKLFPLLVLSLSKHPSRPFSLGFSVLFQGWFSMYVRVAGCCQRGVFAPHVSAFSPIKTKCWHCSLTRTLFMVLSSNFPSPTVFGLTPGGRVSLAY